ncbi:MULTISPECIES: hypothetical protein [Catenuloplanes]|uniref:Uncharacterized protein n=1 Tax=Catenuloplanes niger TaxID=587534 RepID=A0AAE4CVZ0_9ACTN|nr:hypothetical protein [Catenuloplanes niger]MDR7325947.1 hypothetical protein [Catenuloplanes niger]
MTPADPSDAGEIIGVLAADIAQRLAVLRRELEPTRELWSGDRVALGPAAEWTLAADGLLGRDGVVALVSDAMKITWPGYAGVGWTDAVGERAAPVRDR